VLAGALGVNENILAKNGSGQSEPRRGISRVTYVSVEWVEIPGRSRKLSVCRDIQVSVGTHPVFYTVGTVWDFKKVKRPESETGKSPTSRARGKNA